MVFSQPFYDRAIARETIRYHLADSAMWPNPPNTDLSKGFTVAQVAEKRGWAERGVRDILTFTESHRSSLNSKNILGISTFPRLKFSPALISTKNPGFTIIYLTIL